MVSISSDREPILHVLVGEREISDPAALDITRELIESSGRVAVHLRARVPAVTLLSVARDLASRAWVSGGWCVVNGRPDVALAASAQAVQLGRTALPARAARRVLSGDSGVRIGVSVHSAVEAEVAAEDGASYLVAGTAYGTPSHPGVERVGPIGIKGCVAAIERFGVPLYAIGGVTVDRVDELIAAGAAGVVVGRAVWAAPDPSEAVRVLVDTLESALERRV